MAAVSRDRTTLAYLLAPLSIDEFLNGYAQRSPLHVRRDVEAYYERYFNLSEFERVIFGCKITTDDLRMIKDGTPVREESYIWEAPKKYTPPTVTYRSSVVDADRLAGQFAHGCTVNMNNIERYSPGAASLARDLSAFFQSGVGANVYLTPPGNQGFGAHYDTHDTMILQIEGSKRWRVYEPTIELPLDHQIYHRIGHTVPGPLLFETDLMPGDLLYLPRGFFHEGKANEELSLHVTYSIAQPRWVQVAIEALMRAAESDVRLRRFAVDSPSDVPAALAAALTPELLQAALDRLRAEFHAVYRSELDGQLRQVAALNDLSEHSFISKRPSVLYDVEETPNGVRLTFAGKTVGLPASAKAVVNELDSVSAVAVSSLVAHDPKALNIVRRLIQEGFAVQLRPERNHSASVA